MNRWIIIALVVVALGALALRAPHLTLRPMHNDEAVNANKLQALWEQGPKGYHYDPDEYHGPILVYATLPAVWLSGAKDFARINEATLRCVPVVFGMALVLLLWWMRDGLGRVGTLGAALLTAISPAMVFYSRYYIHEMLLVCFTFLLLMAGWRYTRTRHFGWALLGGAALGLMHTTKETFVISLIALVGAAVLTAVWDIIWQRLHSEPDRPILTSLFQRLSWKDGMVALFLAGSVSVVFFTSVFTHGSGLLDSIGTYFHWGRRAGVAHPQPW